MYHIYRLYDKKGQLLYVGCTTNLHTRMILHKNRTPWYREIAKSTFEVVDEKAAALAAGLDAIMKENPLYNKYKRRLPTVHNAEKYHEYLAERSAVAVEMADQRASGLTLQQIADNYGVSRQRVHQILSARR